MTGCISEEPAVDREIDFAKEPPKVDSASENKNPSEAQTPETPVKEALSGQPPIVGLDPTLIYEINETIHAAGLAFSDFKLISVGEGLPNGVSKDRIYYVFDNPVDEVGALQDGNQYVFAEITIQNETSSEKNYYFTSCGFLVVDSELVPIAQGAELSYNSEKNDPTARNFSRVELPPNAKKKIMFAYIMDPNAMEQGTLYFSVQQPQGFSDTMEYLPYVVFKAN
jgi:hypothetical protein